MMLLIGLIVAILAMVSLAGWGLLFNRFSGYRSSGFSMTAAVGLAAVIFIGGGLNLLHIAYGPALDLLFAGGIILFAAAHKAVRKHFIPVGGLPFTGMAWVSALGIAGVAAMSQLVPTAYNFYDDFEKYFTFPVRMLQTGTLTGNQLGSLGSETLGAQALLHAMVLNHFPVSAVNGVDAVFGLLLCLLLSTVNLPPRPLFIPAALLGMATVCTINPQLINISSSYLVCAMVMALLLLYCGNEPDDEQYMPPARHVGLLLAAMIALKTVFVLFAGIYFILLAGAVLFVRTDVRRRLAWLTAVGGSTAVFLAPWIVMYLPNYLHAWSRDTIPPIPPGPENIAVEPFSFISTDVLYYGSSYLDYSSVACITLILTAVICAVQAARNAVLPPLQRIGLFAGGTAVFLSYPMLIVLGPQLNGYFHSVRYSIPLLTAGIPVLGSMITSVFSQASTGWRRGCIAGVLVIEVAVTLLFAGDYLKRLQQGRLYGNTLAFSGLASNPEYLAYNREVLSADHKEYIRRIQEVVPPGRPFFAWITTPFLFDYRRNIVYDAEHSGIGTPWAVMPEVEYYIVEYEGYGVVHRSTLYEDLHFPGARERYVSRKCLSLLNSLDSLRAVAVELYNDGRTVVFKTSGNRS